MDSVGASLGFLLSGMGNRGALAFFSFSTLKTVDDHCGYNLPFNPLQLFFWNNADYHDIHHQSFGIKKNYSQPFGTIWDHILGTHMSREEANAIIKAKEERKAVRLAAAQAAASKNIIKVLDKDDELSSSGNNSGNDSHGEEDHIKPSAVALGNSSVHKGIDLPDFRERLTARSRIDNGSVTGKGQGNAL